MPNKSTATSPDLSHLSVPVFWPMILSAGLMAQGLKLYAKNFKFLNAEIKLHTDLHPRLATHNTIRLDLRTMRLCEYSKGEGVPTIVYAPYAGHTAMIADYHKGQSLVETLMQNGIGHLLLTDWKSATDDMKDFDIDTYLADMVVAIDDLGGRVNLVGLCQGGWMAAMLAARFPDKVHKLVLAGAPIDTDAGNGPIKQMAHQITNAFYAQLVGMGGGLMKGSFMLQGWKNMNPVEHYFQAYIDLYEHIEDPNYLKKEEVFQSWYENPIDLPGRWYLQVIDQIFKRNLLAKGKFIGLGRTLHLKDITCPIYLIAGTKDDITTPEQILDAAHYFGTPASHIVKKSIPGGHIGLFMGANALKNDWPDVARWIMAPLP